MQYSHNNHYKWGWGDDWFNKVQPGLDFHVQIGSCTQRPKSFHDECVRAAKLIVAQFTKPTLVGLSGGSDSQVVCMALLELKHPFTPMIMHLVNDADIEYNKHDTDTAYEFCKQFSLTPIVERVNIDQFYAGRGLELAKDYCLTNVETVLQLYAIEKFKDKYSYIMAGGGLVITKHPDWIGTDADTLLATFGPTPIQQYLIENNVEGVTHFFMYTPELIYSYLNNPVMDLFKRAHVALFDSYITRPGGTDLPPGGWWWLFNLYVKPLFYVDSWPKLVQKRKFTGFEKAAKLLDKARAEMAKGREALDLPNRHILVTIPELDAHLKARLEPKVWVSSSSGPLQSSPGPGT